MRRHAEKGGGSARADAERFPPQVRYIVGNELCERFSYYGMRSILVLYITSALAKTQDQATEIIHYFIFANYFLTLVGGWLSDRVFGRYRTILVISLFYCAGHAVLAASEWVGTVEGKTWYLYAGMGLIAVGSGGIKPCVGAFVGDQFGADQGALLQRAYAAFYWAVNLGSFFAFLIVPWVARDHGYGWAFGIPGILMAVAVVVFWSGRRHYVRVPPSREARCAGFGSVFLHAWKCRSDRRSGMKFWDAARGKYSAEEIEAAAAVGPILGVFALIPIFWALYDQSTSTWVLQGERMEPWRIAGITITAEQMQSANAFLVMVLVPVLTWGIYPRVGRWARPLRRIGMGLFAGSASFLVVAWLQSRIEGGERIGLAWQFLPYVLLTLGEVLVSTTGLEFAFTEAGKRMKSTIMSFWYLTNAFGSLLVSWITRLASTGEAAGAVTTSRFLAYACLGLLASVVFIAVAASYRYRNPANAVGTGVG